MPSEIGSGGEQMPLLYFDGHGEALKQYMRHRPMQHVQGYTGSHWTPPSGDYSLRIALAAARATANKTSM